MRIRFISLFSLLCLATIACTASDPRDPGEGNVKYDVIPVTPALVMQLQQKQRDKYPKPKAAGPDDNSGYAYLLGQGDVLYARVYTPSPASNDGYHPATDAENWTEYNTIMVDNTGNAVFPYAGNLPVADKPLSEVQSLVNNAMRHYFRNPQVILAIKEYHGRRIQVTGEVKNPGVQYLQLQPLYILAAVASAGGALDSADISNATLTHKNGEVEKIDLFSLIDNGDVGQNRMLHEGDTLHIPTNYGNKVFVMGEVVRPNLQYIKAGRMTVTEALNNSQGVNLDSAAYEKIYVIRGAINDSMLPKPKDQTPDKMASAADVSKPVEPMAYTAIAPGWVLDSDGNASSSTTAPVLTNNPIQQLQTRVYALDESNGTGLAMAAQFPLEPNDVIYVSPTAISQWGRFISQLLPSSATSLVNTQASVNGY